MHNALRRNKLALHACLQPLLLLCALVAGAARGQKAYNQSPSSPQLHPQLHQQPQPQPQPQPLPLPLPPPSYASLKLPPPLNMNARDNSVFMRYELDNELVPNYYPNSPSSDNDKNYINYNTIEGKPYVEATTSRCLASTIVDNPANFEPSFVFIEPMSEVRLNATAPIDVIKFAGRFDARKPTVILVHGYTQSYPQTEWLRKVRALFEMHTQLNYYNLIIMDWMHGAESPYHRAAALTSLMGDYLANFIEKLIKLGSNRLSIHIIGHSLGSHVAGFAGRRLEPRIGRITALDPAGPCFGKLYSNSEQDRLNADDAFEVDIYHYDDDFLGLSGQHGQFDVYVNGGASQPGATDNLNSMFGALITVVFGRKKVLSESHQRSYQVMMADLATSSNCQLIAYECADFPAFLNGECGYCDQNNYQCFSMSFPFQYNHGLSEELMQVPLRTSFPGRRFYISTQANDPYCLFHDQVLIKLEPHPKLYEMARKRKLSLHLELFFDPVDKGISPTNLTLTNLMSKNAFSFLMRSSIERRNKFRSARLLITSNYDKIIVPQVTNNEENNALYSNNDQLDAIRVTAIEINHMSKFDPGARRALSSRLCPIPTTAFGTVDAQSFGECPPQTQQPLQPTKHRPSNNANY